MNAETLTRQLDQAKHDGTRVALGFQHRLMMIERIASVSSKPIPGDEGVDDAVYELVGRVYDTAHSRNATDERLFFEAGEVVYIAIPADGGNAPMGQTGNQA